MPFGIAGSVTAPGESAYLWLLRCCLRWDICVNIQWRIGSAAPQRLRALVAHCARWVIGDPTCRTESMRRLVIARAIAVTMSSPAAITKAGTHDVIREGRYLKILTSKSGTTFCASYSFCCRCLVFYKCGAAISSSDIKHPPSLY
jgi:hypothetical protein